MPRESLRQLHSRKAQLACCLDDAADKRPVTNDDDVSLRAGEKVPEEAEDAGLQRLSCLPLPESAFLEGTEGIRVRRNPSEVDAWERLLRPRQGMPGVCGAGREMLAGVFDGKHSDC
jgi:hypothetical protein